MSKYIFITVSGEENEKVTLHANNLNQDEVYRTMLSIAAEYAKDNSKKERPKNGNN